jgi:acetyltransferase-like isoleucine patch superfamily enzyme
LIASGCDISASDFHHVLDAQTGERINPARNVFMRAGAPTNKHPSAYSPVTIDPVPTTLSLPILAPFMIINPARNVFIGEHVWLGSRVTIMKGARIGKDSVVGTGSRMRSSISNRCLCLPLREL